MDSAHWLKQNVNQHRSWFRRVWQSGVATEGLGIDATKLDALLARAVNSKQQSAQQNLPSGATGKAFKHDRTTTVALIDDADTSMVLKRYNARSAAHAFSRAFRRSRASRCWQMSYAFATAGLNVAAPALMLEKRFGPLRLSAYFVNEYLAGHELLSLLPKMSDEQQSQVLSQVKKAFQLMRRAKISHGDMKASNLIWHNETLYFIDLDAAQLHRTRLSWNKSHRKDRARFLKNWRDYPNLIELFADL